MTRFLLEMIKEFLLKFENVLSSKEPYQLELFDVIPGGKVNSS